MATDDEVFSKIIEQMTKIAQADGKLTEEEVELLTEAQINLMLYDEALNEALEDGFISDDEKELLEGIKEQIILQSYELAELTDGLSKDELKLLEILTKKARG